MRQGQLSPSGCIGERRVQHLEVGLIHQTGRGDLAAVERERRANNVVGPGRFFLYCRKASWRFFKNL